MARCTGLILLVVAASVGLSTCGSSSTDSLAPTAIAVKRYMGTGATAGALDAAGFSGGAVFTKIDPSEFEYAIAVALQADGKIIAVGHSVLGGQGVIALVRYKTDGSLDTVFGSSGVVRTAVPSVNAVGTAIAMQGTQILVAGSTFNPSTGMTGIAVVRYDANGLLDTAGFGTAGIVSAEIGPGTDTDLVSLALQGTNIIVAGATSEGNFVLQRYDSNGVLDTTFGTTGTATTNVGSSATSPAIALQSTGEIVAAGGARSSTSSAMNAVLVRYDTNGILDTGFGGGVNGGIVLTPIGSSDSFSNAVVVQPTDNKIVVAGHANVNFSADTSDITLLRYSPAGALETTFGLPAQAGKVVTTLGGFDNAFSVALQADLKIVVSGNTRSASSAVRVAVLRFNATGTLDTTFDTDGLVTTQATGPSTIASGNAVLVQPDGGIVVAGYD